MPSTALIKERKKGRVGQDYVAGMFESWGLKVRNVPDGHFPYWDMEIEGRLHGYDIKITVEVKHDYRLEETGNFYLDIEALKHSKAGILAIVEGDPPHTVYMLPLADALKYAESHQVEINGGEFWEPAVLVPKQVFIELLKPQVLKAPLPF